jgi:hypothetical protein
MKKLLALSADEMARLFRVSKGTILRWELEAGKEPGKETIGSLLRPIPPVRRYADIVHHLVQTMDRLGFGGSEKVASTLGASSGEAPQRSLVPGHHPGQGALRIPAAQGCWSTRRLLSNAARHGRVRSGADRARHREASWTRPAWQRVGVHLLRA